MSSCKVYRDQIPRALFDDLTSDEARELEAHLAACAGCRQERVELAQTLGLLRSFEEIDSPQHLLVKENPPPWVLYTQLGTGWRRAIAALLVLAVSGVVFAIAGLQVGASNGSLTVGFGRLQTLPSKEPSIDPAQIERDLVLLVADKLEQAEKKWSQQQDAELQKILASLESSQSSRRKTDIARLEERLRGNLEDHLVTVRADFEGTFVELYRRLAAERVKDMQFLNGRINLLAASGELQGDKTDALMDTLIQMADRGAQPRN